METDNVARALAMQARNNAPSLDDTANAIIAGGNSAAAYRSAMRMWFQHKLPSDWTAAQLTELCNEWYTITHTGWDGWTTFYQPDVSAVSTGTRGGDNVGMVCTPSTDTVANRDDFAGLPLFAIVDCNWIVDENALEPIITAIDGITDNFVRDDPKIYVGVLQMAGYHWTAEDDDTYTHGYCDALLPYANIAPVPEAVRVDDTVRPWVVHSKYMSATVNGKMTSCAGLTPTINMSHNLLHTLSAKNGKQYSGGTTADWGWLVLMAYIKYASLTLDGILQGCCSYDYQYPAAVSETDVKRVLVAAAQASNLIVGSTVIIGTYTTTRDRSTAAVRGITGDSGAKITKITPVVVDGTQYSAVYVDTDTTFSTVANGTDTNGTTYISTWHWRTGSCDGVLGNDGSPVNCTSGKCPARLQGIEYMVGGYETLADVILDLAKKADVTYIYRPAVVRRSAKQATSITSNYAVSGIECLQPIAGSWQYIKRLAYSDGVFFPVLTGGSSSTYTRDAFYENTNTVATREWLAFGGLVLGTANAGLSALSGRYALSSGLWTSLARQSLRYYVMHCTAAAKNSSRRQKCRPTLRGKLIKEPADW